MSKRMLSAFQKAQSNPEPTEPRAEQQPDASAGRELVGAWSKNALDISRIEVEHFKRDAYDAIIQGKRAVKIPIDAISDNLGTDRVASTDEGDELGSFATLKQNIADRGLQSPIRVRPVDPNWRPDINAPTTVGDQKFYIQSGRRRLQACRELEIVPDAFITFVDAESADLNDLKERFFENVLRKDLNVYEKMLSIGEFLHRSLNMYTLTEAAKLLHISKSYASRAGRVYEFDDQLRTMLNPATANTKAILSCLKSIESPTGNQGPDPDIEKVRNSLKSRENSSEKINYLMRDQQVGGSFVSSYTTNDGDFILQVRTRPLTEEELKVVFMALEQLEG